VRPCISSAVLAAKVRHGLCRNRLPKRGIYTQDFRGTQEAPHLVMCSCGQNARVEVAWVEVEVRCDLRQIIETFSGE
jgi:hypothetical protein